MFLVSFNGSEPPQLGDRVVNLYATGVPFGLRGTIVAIHSNTGYTEVNIFRFKLFHIYNKAQREGEECNNRETLRSFFRTLYYYNYSGDI